MRGQPILGKWGHHEKIENSHNSASLRFLFFWLSTSLEEKFWLQNNYQKLKKIVFQGLSDLFYKLSYIMICCFTSEEKPCSNKF